MNGSKIWLGFSSLLITGGCIFVFIVFTTAMSTGEFSLGAIISAFGLLLWGSIFFVLRENRPQFSSTSQPQPKIDINWYLTDVFVKFVCPCTPHEVQEDDGYMFGRIKCQNCHEVWEIAPVSVKPLAKK